MDRLSLATLPRAAAAVRRPDYDRGAVAPGIVHLGVGAFARAHIFAYIDALLARDPAWGIVGASLRRADMHDALAPQDWLYTLAVRSGAGTDLRVIGSLLDILVAPADPGALVARLADPRTRIVTLTITEKGYCHDPATGDLDPGHPDIRRDLAAPETPGSAPGLILRALEARRAAGTPAFTVMPCDNLPSNGPTFRRILHQYAALTGSGLAGFVAEELAVAGTMVDRIVPATTPEDTAAISAALGLEDAWPVVTEPFTQWVVEDRFSAGRPDLAAAGVELVHDVEGHERMKLRMLNGAHSAIAYLGYLAGHETVADTMNAPGFEGFVRGLMTDEVMPTLTLPGVDLGAYRDALVTRFRNPALRHRTWQIAMDGSQKIPQRWMGTIRADRAAGRPVPRLALGLAAWITYVGGRDEQGGEIDVRDPMKDRLAALARETAGTSPAEVARAFLGIEAIFGPDAAADAPLADAVGDALEDLRTRGAAAAVAAFPTA